MYSIKAQPVALLPGGAAQVSITILDGMTSMMWFLIVETDPSLAWGNGFGADIGATVTFNNVRTDDTDWTSTVTQEGNSGDYGQSSFPLSRQPCHFLLSCNVQG